MMSYQKSDLTSRTSWCVCCRFIIGREKPGEQSEVAQLIQQTLEQERWQREMMEQRYNQYMEEDEEVRPHTPIQQRFTHSWQEAAILLTSSKQMQKMVYS